MSYLEEVLPKFRKGARIRRKDWDKGNYCILKNGEVINQDNEKVVRFSTRAVLTDQWELYQDPEPDWQYIIDHKCLCWFWEDDEEKRIANYLQSIGVRKNNSFIDANNFIWKNCRPIRRDEVNFYEDRKDENNDI